MDTWGALESLNRMMLCGLITAFPHAMIQRAWPLGHPAMTALACTFEKFFARAAASLPEDCWGLGLKRSLSTQKTLGELRHLLQWGAHAPCTRQGYPAPSTCADSRADCISHLARRSPSALRSDGIIDVDNELANLVAAHGDDAKPTASFHRVLQRAAIHVQ